MSRIAACLASNLLRRICEWLFSAELWNVGVAEMTAADLLIGKSLAVQWLPRHRFGHYVADPFIYRTGSRRTCLVEEFSHFGRGRISELEIAPMSRTLAIRPVLEAPYHLSYPHLVHDGGQLFCVPEAHESGRLTLYRYGSDSFVPIAEMIRGPLADATILRHHGRYWLFCGLEDDDATTNLHLFFATTLLGPWIPHPLNPVKTDIGSARPAGAIFSVGNALYRPSQDCSITYGGGLCINRIDVLTTTRFCETLVARYGPDEASPYSLGIHTLSVGDGFIVVDGKGRMSVRAALATLPFRLWRRFRRAKPTGLPMSEFIMPLSEGSGRASSHVPKRSSEILGDCKVEAPAWVSRRAPRSSA
jgi:hypothetical protein